MELVRLSPVPASRTIIDDPIICEWLREITRFLVHHKSRLPGDVQARLSEAFASSHKSTNKRQSGPRASIARARLSPVQDVHPSPQLLLELQTFRHSPIEFWTEELRLKVGRDNNNIFRGIYKRNRALETASVMYRAFDTTATYLLLLKLCDAFNTNILSPSVFKHCYTIILGQESSPEERALVKKNLKADFHAGKRWDTYARELGGYGVFFLIGVVPPWMYEITWNSREDLKFVVSHFKSIRVPEIAKHYNLHELGNRIMSEFESRTKSYIPPKRREERRKRPATISNTGRPNKRAHLKHNPSIPDDRNISLPSEASTSTTISRPSRESALVDARDSRVVQELTQPLSENLPLDAFDRRLLGMASHNSGALRSFSSSLSQDRASPGTSSYQWPGQTFQDSRLQGSYSQDRDSSSAHDQTYMDGRNVDALSSTSHAIFDRSPPDATDSYAALHLRVNQHSVPPDHGSSQQPSLEHAAASLEQPKSSSRQLITTADLLSSSFDSQGQPEPPLTTSTPETVTEWRTDRQGASTHREPHPAETPGAFEKSMPLARGTTDQTFGWSNRALQIPASPEYISNPHAVNSQTDVTYDSLDPRPYLTYTPPFAASGLSISREYETTEYASIISNMDMTSNGLDPRPYLTYTPAHVAPDLPHTLQFEIENTEDERSQNLTMPSTISDIGIGQNQMNMTSSSLDPRPYLTYNVIPGPSGPQERDTSESMSVSLDPNQANMTFDGLDPRPYLTYMPSAQPAATDEQETYISSNQQIEGSPAQQIGLSECSNVADWHNQSRGQMAYRTNGLDGLHQLGLHPPGFQLALIEAR